MDEEKTKFLEEVFADPDHFELHLEDGKATLVDRRPCPHRFLLVTPEEALPYVECRDCGHKQAVMVLKNRGIA